MDLANFVPPAMLPMPMQNANSILSQRQFKIVAGRRNRDNPQSGTILYLCFHTSMLRPLRCFVNDRADRLKDVRWRASISVPSQRSRRSREAGGLPDLEAPRPVQQSRCCCATGPAGPSIDPIFAVESAALGGSKQACTAQRLHSPFRSFPSRQLRVDRIVTCQRSGYSQSCDAGRHHAPQSASSSPVALHQISTGAPDCAPSIPTTFSDTKANADPMIIEITMLTSGLLTISIEKMSSPGLSKANAATAE
jgi:hypothetical protein